MTIDPKTGYDNRRNDPTRIPDSIRNQAHAPDRAPTDPHSFAASAAVYGLHPLVAFGMVAADWMLFTGLEIPSLGVLAAVSFVVGLALVLPCVLIQRFAYADSWGAAIGKGTLVGLLTAIPTALPSFLIAGWGVVGAVGLKHRRAIDTTGTESQLRGTP
jgi:hypothetical protein